MNKKIIIICIMLFTGADLFGFISFLKRKIDKANAFFNRNEYDKAQEIYREAETDDPENAKIHYNIGNTYYKKKLYEKAIEEYNKALSTDDPDFQAKIYYNLGNAFYKTSQYDKAVLSYKKSLTIHPDDKSCKFNLELA
ncbi:tetratricopeptide repeat protein, partial [Spirochaetota bacterium]